MELNRNVRNLAKRISAVPRTFKDGQLHKKNSHFPAGHYYSPIVSVDEIKKRADEIWKNENVDGIVGIELKREDQLALVKNFEKFYAEIPFAENKSNGHRYYFENQFYSYTDAIMLYSMIRHFKPKQIIEVGSGFSSAVMLDTNELFFDNSIRLTFIEPYTSRLNTLLTDKDRKNTTIIETDVQVVPFEVFEQLNAGDILFIDSTHVAKTGSDVNFILFEILPRLKAGVLIHFHDIFYPFEYPKDWVYKGRNWNEDYFLRAFLMYNQAFEIKLFSNYLHMLHPAAFEQMPLCYKNFGANLWLERK